MTAALAPAAALPAGRTVSRTELAAAWLVVLPVLTEGVFPGVVKLQVAGVAALAIIRAASGKALPPLGVERALTALGVLVLTACGYWALGSWPAGGSYGTRAVMWVLAYGAIAVYAALFWDLEALTAVIWRGFTIALWIGVATCALSRLTGHLLLVNAGDGALRMTGTLTEPSDWAPILVAVLLLAWRRRAWVHVALALAGLYLADSPTCILVMAASLVLYAALAWTWRGRALLLAALAVIVPLAGAWVLHADPQQYLYSSNGAVVAGGRLVSGIQAAASGSGDAAANTRYASTEASLAVIREDGWMQAGDGPGSDAAWFSAEYAPGAAVPFAVNSLWVSVLWDEGEWGLAVLAVLLAAAAWRMRRSPLLCTLLLPFCVASMVNSAIPDWSLTALAVFSAGLGWGLPDLAGAGLGPVKLSALSHIRW